MSEARAALRRRLRAARDSLDEAALRDAARAVAAHLAPLLETCAPRTVAGYVALGGELRVTEALRACRARGATTLLPALLGDGLAFSPFDETSTMRPNRYGIDEPDVPDSARLAPSDVELVLVPLVGFDTRLNRLGMGGGYYDRSFASRREHAPPPLLVGVAHELQRVDDVHPDWWDVPLDVVVTDTTVRHRR